jgi:hypothetical protein
VYNGVYGIGKRMRRAVRRWKDGKKGIIAPFGNSSKVKRLNHRRQHRRLLKWIRCEL